MASSGKWGFPSGRLLILLPFVSEMMKNILKTNKKCIACPCPLAKKQVPAMYTLLLGTTTAPCSLWQPSCHQHAGRRTGGSWTRRSIVPVPPCSPNSISCPQGGEGYILLTTLPPSSLQWWVLRTPLHWQTVGSPQQQTRRKSATFPLAFVWEAFLCCSRGLVQTDPVYVCQQIVLWDHGGLC